MSFQQPDRQGPYQPYPGQGFSNDPGLAPGAPKPPLPDQVRNAFYLMLDGAVVSLISLVVGLGSKSALRTSVQNASPNLTPDQVTTAVNFGYALVIVIGLIGAGLWIWMAFANKAGRNWARITGTVFFGLDTLSLIGDLSRHTTTGAGLAIGAVTWLIGLAAVILIWNKASGAYYKPQAQFPAQFPPYGGGGYPQQ